MPPIIMTCELTFRSGRTRPTRVKSSGSETLLRILFLADCTIDMHDSSFQKRQPFASSLPYYNYTRYNPARHLQDLT